MPSKVFEKYLTLLLKAICSWSWKSYGFFRTQIEWRIASPGRFRLHEERRGLGMRLVSPLYNLDFLINRLLIKLASTPNYYNFWARACGSTNGKGQSAKNIITKQNKPRSRSATVTWERDSATKCQSNIVAMSTRVVSPCWSRPPDTRSSPLASTVAEQ